MKEHITLEALLNIVFGVIGIVLTYVGAVAICKVGFMAVTACCVKVVAPVIAILVIIVFVLQVIAGIGLLMRLGWARNLVKKLPFWITL